MSNSIPSQITAIVLLSLWSFLTVPSCVIRIGPGDTDDDKQVNTTGGNDVNPDEPSQSEQEVGEEEYGQLEPQELALASAKAGFTTS
jgi:hypothetical protein